MEPPNLFFASDDILALKWNGIGGAAVGSITLSGAPSAACDSRATAALKIEVVMVLS